MTRKSIENLSHQQYNDRLRPLINQINREIAANAPFEHNQALDNNNHQNNDNQLDIGAQNFQIDHQEPLPPK